MSDAITKRTRRWRWLVLGSAWWAYAGLYFCRKAFYAVKDALGDQLGFNEVDLSYIGAVYLITYTTGQFIAASVGQRVGARRWLLIGMASSVAANVVFAFSANLWTFMLFMAVNGVAQAAGWSCCMGAIGAWTTRQERGTIMGFWATCYQLGSVMATNWAGLWLGLSFLDIDGAGSTPDTWRQAFLAGAAVLFLTWLGVWAFLRNQPEDVGLPPVVDNPEQVRGAGDESGTSGQDPASHLSDVDTAFRWTRSLITTILLVGVCYMGIKFVRYAVWSWSAYFLSDYYHLEGDVAAYYSTVFDWGGFAGVIVAGYLSDRFFGARRATLSFVMLGGMTAACVFLYVFGTASVAMFIGGMVMVGFMLYGPDSLLSGAGAIDLGSRRAAIAAAGIINGMGSAGSVIQELGVARIYRASESQIGPVFALLIGASAVSLLSLGIVLWRNRRGLSDL